MPFKRFVQTGRVALVSEGPHQGKLVSIVDVIDQNRVLIDGPQSQIPRREMRLNALHLTKFCLKFPYTGKTRVVRKAWHAAKLDEQWRETMWSKKVEAKKKRLALSDFDRFKLRKARQVRNKIRSDAFFRLKRILKIAKKVKAAKAAITEKTAKPTAKSAAKKPEKKKAEKK